MDECSEGKSVFPGIGEILHVNIRVAFGVFLAPQQQSILAIETVAIDLELVDQTKDHPHNLLEVIVNDVFSRVGNLQFHLCFEIKLFKKGLGGRETDKPLSKRN